MLSPFGNASCDKMLGLMRNPHPESKKHTSTTLLPAPVALHSPCITAGTSKNNPCRLLYLSGGGRMLVPAMFLTRVQLLQVHQPLEHATCKLHSCSPKSPEQWCMVTRGMLLCSCPSQGGWGAVPASFLAHSCSSPASLCLGCPLLLRLAGLSGLSLISSCSTEKKKNQFSFKEAHG